MALREMTAVQRKDVKLDRSGRKSVSAPPPREPHLKPAVCGEKTAEHRAAGRRQLSSETPRISDSFFFLRSLLFCLFLSRFPPAAGQSGTALLSPLNGPLIYRSIFSGASPTIFNQYELITGARRPITGDAVKRSGPMGRENGRKGRDLDLQ